MTLYAKKNQKEREDKVIMAKGGFIDTQIISNGMGDRFFQIMKLNKARKLELCLVIGQYDQIQKVYYQVVSRPMVCIYLVNILQQER